MWFISDAEGTNEPDKDLGNVQGVMLYKDFKVKQFAIAIYSRDKDKGESFHIINKCPFGQEYIAKALFESLSSEVQKALRLGKNKIYLSKIINKIGKMAGLK